MFIVLPIHDLAKLDTAVGKPHFSGDRNGHTIAMSSSIEVAIGLDAMSGKEPIEAERAEGDASLTFLLPQHVHDSPLVIHIVSPNHGAIGFVPELPHAFVGAKERSGAHDEAGVIPSVSHGEVDAALLEQAEDLVGRGGIARRHVRVDGEANVERRVRVVEHARGPLFAATPAEVARVHFVDDVDDVEQLARDVEIGDDGHLGLRVRRGRGRDGGTQLLDVLGGLRGFLHVGRQAGAASAAVHVENDALVRDDEGFLGVEAVWLCFDDDARNEGKWGRGRFLLHGDRWLRLGDEGEEMATVGLVGVATVGFAGVTTVGFAGVTTVDFAGVATVDFAGVATVGFAGVATVGFMAETLVGFAGDTAAGVIEETLAGLASIVVASLTGDAVAFTVTLTLPISADCTGSVPLVTTGDTTTGRDSCTV